MQTIDEATNEYVNNYTIIFPESAVKKAFKAGVEFAQKFINVDEKIPIEFTPVLFKTKDGGLYLGIYYSKKEYGKWFRSVEEPDIDYCVDLDNQDEVIEWRYVDL